MAGLTGEWELALREEFSKDYYKKLFYFIKEQYSKVAVYPKADEIFTAFHLTPLEKVKVVIIGQDPYHNVGQAHGLCFSVCAFLLNQRLIFHLLSLIFIRN